MKKLRLCLAILAALFLGVISTSASELSGEYLIQNVQTGQYLAGGVSWGTQACLNGKPQWFALTVVSDGKYTIDSHQYNNATNHFLGTGLYCDQVSTTWDVTETSTSGIYTISNNGNYIAGNSKNNPIITVTDATSANAQWKFITKDEIIALQENATEDNPVDVTAFIIDPQLKRNGNTNWYNHWTITGFDGTGSPSSFNQGQGGNFADCGESYHSTNGFKATQTITDLKSGLYTVSASGFYRDDDATAESALPYIFANGKTSNLLLKTGDEDDMISSYTSFLAGEYKLEPIKVAVTDGKIELGVAGSATDLWSIFGEFTLMYYGPLGIEAAQNELNDKIAEAQAITGKMNATVATDLANAITTAQKASTYDEISDATSTITDAINAANTSVSVYATINDLITSYATSVSTFDDAGKAAYDITTVQTAYDNGTITDGTAEKAALLAAVQKAVRAQGVGTDYTLLLSNPDFKTDDLSGWNTNGLATPTVDPANHDCEFYEKTFNLSQTITNLKKGTYEISFQAFQRPGANSTGLADAFLADNWTSSAQLYTSAEYSEVMHVCKEWQDNALSNVEGWFADAALTPTGGTTHYVPNGMAGGRQWFDAGYYKTTAKAIVTEDGGSLTFGFKGTSSSGCWILFDNFKLKYISATALVDEAESEKIIASATSLESEPMYTGEKDKLTSAKEALAADKTNATLFSALNSELSAAQTSIDAYKTAAATLENMKALTESTNVFTTESYNTYYAEPKAKYDAGSLTNDEALALQDPTAITGWHAALTCDNFLMSSWDAEADVYGDYYINTWSTEGENDGSNFKVPFFEYFTDESGDLATKTLTATVNGLEAGTYEISATVRVRIDNAAAEEFDLPTGITFQANNGPLENACGEENNDTQFPGSTLSEPRLFVKEVMTYGNVGSDGVLKIKFNVQEGNNVHWLAFKNVNYKKSDKEMITIDYPENSTICYDYDASIVDGSASTAYEFTGIYEKNVYGKPVTVIEHSIPYIVTKGSLNLIKADPDAEPAIEGKNYNGFYGIAGDDPSASLKDSRWLLFKDGDLCYAKNSSVAKGYGYFQVNEIPASSSVTIGAQVIMPLNIEDFIPTGINTIDAAQNANAPVYNLAGQRVDKVQKGIYIINGHKVVK